MHHPASQPYCFCIAPIILLLATPAILSLGVEWDLQKPNLKFLSKTEGWGENERVEEAHYHQNEEILHSYS